MSAYEDYHSVSKHYDKGDCDAVLFWHNSLMCYYDYIARQPVGVDVILGAMAHVKQGIQKLNESSLVDIGESYSVGFQYIVYLLTPPGCGTGNYALALSPYIGEITGIEYNEGMLEKARKKMVSLPHVKLLQGNALNLPLRDGYCDAVICTLVSVI